MLNPCEEEFQNVSGRNLAVGAAQSHEKNPKKSGRNPKRNSGKKSKNAGQKEGLNLCV